MTLARQTVCSVALSGLQGRIVRFEAGGDVPLVDPLLLFGTRSSVCVRSSVSAALDLPLREVRLTASESVPPLLGACDLAAAAALLASLRGRLTDFSKTVVLGQVGLSGQTISVRGVFPSLLYAKEQGFDLAIVPPGNAQEALLAAAACGIEVFVAPTLSDAAEGLARRATASMCPAQPIDMTDFSDLALSAGEARALTLAAAGRHGLLLVGPPGCGRTAIARRMAGILPPAPDLLREAVSLHSIAGLQPTRADQPPFRAPHHTISAVGLCGGGGTPARVGEVSLATGGVLFLDEVTEFRRSVLEHLASALERGASWGFPAKPMVIAACASCPCGYRGDGHGRCACSHREVEAHLRRLDPLSSVLDIAIELPRVGVTDLRPGGYSSGAMRVMAAGTAERAARTRVERATRTAIASALLTDRPARTQARAARVAATASFYDDGDRGVTVGHLDEALALTSFFREYGFPC